MAEEGGSERDDLESSELSDEDDGSLQAYSTSSDSSDDEPGTYFYVSDFVSAFLEDRRQRQKVIFDTSEQIEPTLTRCLLKTDNLKRALPPISEVPSKVPAQRPLPPSAHSLNRSPIRIPAPTPALTPAPTHTSSRADSDLVAALLSNVSSSILSGKRASIAPSAQSLNRSPAPIPAPIPAPTSTSSQDSSDLVAALLSNVSSSILSGKRPSIAPSADSLNRSPAPIPIPAPTPTPTSTSSRVSSDLVAALLSNVSTSILSGKRPSIAPSADSLNRSPAPIPIPAPAPAPTPTSTSSQVSSNLVAALLSNVSSSILSGKRPSIAPSPATNSNPKTNPRSSNILPGVPTYPWPASNFQAQPSAPKKVERLVPERATPSTSTYQEPASSRILVNSASEIYPYLFELSTEYEVSLRTTLEAIRLEKHHFHGKMTGLYKDVDPSQKAVEETPRLKTIEETPRQKAVEENATQQLDVVESTPVRKYPDHARKGGPYKNKPAS